MQKCAEQKLRTTPSCLNSLRVSFKLPFALHLVVPEHAPADVENESALPADDGSKGSLVTTGRVQGETVLARPFVLKRNKALQSGGQRYSRAPLQGYSC